ncbi:MAG: hypothetical protein K2O40_06680 [Lachnospiraceae bacterium]|nr:hypothetical protein [Lachnospiraceae bacterium]MDE7184150.1 hypothetical protein [Lachnospiraceae bacterium]
MSEFLDNIRSRIESSGINFEFKGTIKTSMNHIERETWVLEYEGAQFVYVAGQKNVTLGWDTRQCPLGDGVSDALREYFEQGQEYYQDLIDEMKEDYENQIMEAAAKGNSKKADKLRAVLAGELDNIKEEMRDTGNVDWAYFMTKWNAHLSECLSPLRTADIGDLIVEVDCRYLEQDAPSLEDAVRSLKEGPFTLATEDEWEYLCNGGARTLFRWGDTLSDVLPEIFNVGCVSDVKEKSILEQANMLGLYIAYNSYKCEIIDNTMYVKGGDGGCSLCGGDGAIYILPCYTAFYRQPIEEYHRTLSNNYFCYRRIIRLP